MVEFFSVSSEADLLPNHNEPPIYIPSLKSVLTFGHFVLINTERPDGSTESLVGQLLRHHDANNVVICILLPLFHEGTLQHINTPSILPPRVTHASCINVLE